VNKPILRALFLDAYYQVLDNKVFRILAGLVFLLVLPAFLIGFRPQGIVFFWGVKTIGYQEFVGWFGQHLPADAKDVNIAFIQGVQQIVIGAVAGNVGIFFCLAATAFFVPRMLEKGAADVIFSRPIGRATLLAARYCAGVLFVFLLGCVLVLGIHVGLLLVSGASDSAFLWSILTLTYVFALVHAVSTLVAVYTRSSVAAILSALLFFTFNGCVHPLWIKLEAGRAKAVLESEDNGTAPEPEHGAAGFFTGTLDALHFALPKTTDADVIVYKLRTLVSGKDEVLRDPQGSLLVRPTPAGWSLASPGGIVDLAANAAVWNWSDAKESAGQLTLRRQTRLIPGDKPRRRSSAAAAREQLASLKLRPEVKDAANSTLQSSRLPLEVVAWNEERDAQPAPHASAYFSSGDWMYVLEFAGPSAAERLREFSDCLAIDRDDPRHLEAEAWYARRLDWFAPLRHNIFFSLGSSIGFALLCFALAAWRLKRIDF
jgi:ABC-type transport system involved in multi-copper enzyme maturation permease subunit